MASTSEHSLLSRMPSLRVLLNSIDTTTSRTMRLPSTLTETGQTTSLSHTRQAESNEIDSPHAPDSHILLPLSRQDTTIASPATSASKRSTSTSHDPYPDSKPTSTQQTPTPPSPPPSTLTTYLICTAAFFPYLSSWGLLNTFGVFQTHYTTTLLPTTPTSRIAWIGSTQAFLLLFISILTGPLIDIGYTRLLLVAGSCCVFVGMLTTSFCTEYYQLMLAQGLLVGVGAGLLFLPTITIPPLWLRKERRTVVLGLVATGSSVGAILFSVVFEGMVGRVGFGWACRTIAFVTVPGNLFAVVVLRLPEQAARKEGRALVDWSMAKEDVFRMLCASAFVVFVGLYIPVFFVQEYAAVKTDLGDEVVRYLVPVLMTGQTVGRVLPNVVAERIGTLNVSIGITVGCAVLAFAWVAVASSAGVVVWAVLYGFVSGGYVSLLPPLVVALAPDLARLGTRMGMAIGCGSFGVLLGAPVGGALLADTGSYVGLQCWTGASLASGALLLLWIRYSKLKIRLVANV